MSQYQNKKNFSAVSDNLRAMRGGLSQAEFAIFLGIPNQVTYHRYESGRVPKAHILQGIATILGIKVDELLTPISHVRAFEIVAAAMTNAPVPQASPKKVTAETARALGEAAGELITPKSIKAMTDTFQLQRLAHKDLSHLFEHVVMVSNRAPLELAKYYVLIRYAVGKEVARRYGIFEEQPQVKENSSLTDNSDFRKVPLDVKLPRSMQQMLEDVRRFTKAHGMKAALAKYLNVPQARVSEWLDGKYEPSGKTTLKMLHWVEQQELQK